MKKTYKAPKYKTIDLAGEEMIAQSITTGDDIQSGENVETDVKAASKFNLWDDEW